MECFPVQESEKVIFKLLIQNFYHQNIDLNCFFFRFVHEDVRNLRYLVPGLNPVEMNYISSQTHLLANIKLSGTNQMFYSMYLLKNRLIQWYSGTYKTMEIEDNY